MIVGTIPDRSYDELVAKIPKINIRCGSDATVVRDDNCYVVCATQVGEGLLHELSKADVTLLCNMQQSNRGDITISGCNMGDTRLCNMPARSNSVWGIKNKVWVPDVAQAICYDIKKRISGHVDDVSICRSMPDGQSRAYWCVKFLLKQRTFSLHVSNINPYAYRHQSSACFRLDSLPHFQISGSRLVSSGSPRVYVERHPISMCAGILFEKTVTAWKFKQAIIATLAMRYVYEWLCAHNVPLSCISIADVATRALQARVPIVVLADVVTFGCPLTTAPTPLLRVLPALREYMRSVWIDVDELPFGCK